MNRVGEGGKGESVWLGWFLHAALDGLRAWPMRARQVRARRHGGAHAGRWKTALEAKAGTAIGIGAPFSTTEHRSAQPRTTNAASIPSRSRGASSPARDRRDRAARAMAAVDRVSDPAVATAWRCSSRRRSIDRRSTPDTSRATRRACARMVAITRMPPCWSVIAFAMLGDGDKAGESVLRCLIRSTTPARAATSPLQGGALCRCGRCLRGTAPCRARRLDLVHGLGGLDVSRRPRVHPWISHAGQRPASRSVHSQVMAGFRDHVPTRRPRYEIVVENPQGVRRGITRAELDGMTLPGTKLGPSGKDDGAIHRVRVVLG